MQRRSWTCGTVRKSATVSRRRGRSRNRHHARHARAHQFSDLLQFDVAIVISDRQREMKAFAFEAFGQVVRYHRIEAAPDVRDQQSDQMARTATHHPRRRIRDVTEFLRNDAHPFLGFPADVRMIRQSSAHRRDRQIKLLRYVPDCDHYQASPIASWSANVSRIEPKNRERRQRVLENGLTSGGRDEYHGCERSHKEPKGGVATP